VDELRAVARVLLQPEHDVRWVASLSEPWDKAICAAAFVPACRRGAAVQSEEAGMPLEDGARLPRRLSGKTGNTIQARWVALRLQRDGVEKIHQMAEQRLRASIRECIK